jgi:hypothetical protein
MKKTLSSLGTARSGYAFRYGQTRVTSAGNLDMPVSEILMEMARRFQACRRKKRNETERNPMAQVVKLLFLFGRLRVRVP